MKAITYFPLINGLVVSTVAASGFFISANAASVVNDGTTTVRTSASSSVSIAARFTLKAHFPDNLTQEVVSLPLQGSRESLEVGGVVKIDSNTLGTNEIHGTTGSGYFEARRPVADTIVWESMASINPGSADDLPVSFTTDGLISAGYFNSTTNPPAPTVVSSREVLVPEPMTILGTGLVLTFLPVLKKHNKKAQ